jgi:hypothetical protein
MTVQELYDARVKLLPAGDRLRLASLILGDLAAADPPAVDVSDAWSDEDIADMTAHAMRYAAESNPEDEGDDA